jgi:hypothetical protein
MSERVTLVAVIGAFLLAGLLILLGGCAIHLPEAEIPLGRTGYSAFASAEVGIKQTGAPAPTPIQWPATLGLAK